MARVVDPDRFILLGAVTDWAQVRKLHGHEQRPEEIARRRKIDTRIVQLRWLFKPAPNALGSGLGYPTAPFKVWRRPSMPMELEKEVDDLTTFQLPFPFSQRWVAWQEPRVFIRATIQVTSTSATIMAFAGAPTASALVGQVSLSPGTRTISFGGPAIQSLVMPNNATLLSITGLTGVSADDKSWELIEIVGLPVDRNAWAGTFDLDSMQGFPSNLVEPVDAALDRFRRGAPFYGWDAFMETGVPAPPWELADPKAIIQTLEDNVHGFLLDMIQQLPPELHHTKTLDSSLVPPGGGDPAKTQSRPLETLVFGAATDGLLSLVSGFGTAFDDEDIPPIILGDQQFFNDPTRSDWDYMVTAEYSKGLDGNSDPVEYAAMLFRPSVAGSPPVPADLQAATDGRRAPAIRDLPWEGITRVSWDKVPDTMPFRVGSYAFARRGVNPASGAEALMEKRPNDSALQPVTATTSLDEEQKVGRLRALDERYAIATVPNPNTVRYGLAHQDLFGLWSAWSVTGHTIGEPAAGPVTILSSRLQVSAPASGSICPATLVVEVAWDWTVRSLERIELRGRLFAQSKPGEAPSSLAVPGGLQTLFGGGAGSPFIITFGGGANGSPAAVIQYLAEDGQTLVATPPTTAGPRRYRITIQGFQLDYASTGHIGLALWARGKEHRAPQRDGPFSSQPTIVTASDPRPPIIALEHEDVLLASMADAAGEHHARLSWPAVPGAVGYFVYTATETKIRVDRGMTDPLPGLTRSQRLAELRNAFAADTNRRSFTRVNARAITGTSTDIVIPRGSKEIHFYVVLGVSAGQVESEWPGPGDPDRRKRPIAYAAPQVAVPSPPTLELSRFVDRSVTPEEFRAQLRIGTRPGAQVVRIDLHRVRVPEAALALDTMGPPVASITGSTSTWSVQPTPGTGAEAQLIGVVTGLDDPGGSWKRVFYRAVAWSADDPTRGIYGGRSQPSPAQAVVIPPSTPPDLSPISSSWPGGALPDVLLTATSSAPVGETDLGHHRFRADVSVRKPDGSVVPLFRHPAPSPNGELDDRVSSTGTTPPPATQSGAWREPGPTAGTTRYRVMARRESVDDVLLVRFQLTDPLGRLTERTLEVPAGSPLPAPDILSPTITKVPGKGFIFAFQTSVPIPATPAGPYILRVGFSPGLFPNSPATGVQSPLGNIPLIQPGEQPFNAPQQIPLRRGKTVGGVTQFGVYIRSQSGRLTVTLEGPDGRQANIRRQVT